MSNASSPTTELTTAGAVLDAVEANFGSLLKLAPCSKSSSSNFRRAKHIPPRYADLLREELRPLGFEIAGAVFGMVRRRGRGKSAGR